MSALRKLRVKREYSFNSGRARSSFEVDKKMAGGDMQKQVPKRDLNVGRYDLGYVKCTQKRQGGRHGKVRCGLPLVFLSVMKKKSIDEMKRRDENREYRG